MTHKKNHHIRGFLGENNSPPKLGKFRTSSYSMPPNIFGGNNPASRRQQMSDPFHSASTRPARQRTPAAAGPGEGEQRQVRESANGIFAGTGRSSGGDNRSGVRVAWGQSELVAARPPAQAAPAGRRPARRCAARRRPRSARVAVLAARGAGPRRQPAHAGGWPRGRP